MAEYIDKQETIKKVCEGCNIMFDGEPCEPSDCSILKRLLAIPAADVAEVRHGKWVEIPSMAPEYKCSECEKSYEWWEPSEAHYCPNCGARMDGGAENA